MHFGRLLIRSQRLQNVNLKSIDIYNGKENERRLQTGRWRLKQINKLNT